MRWVIIFHLKHIRLLSLNNKIIYKQSHTKKPAQNAGFFITTKDRVYYLTPIERLEMLLLAHLSHCLEDTSVTYALRLY